MKYEALAAAFGVMVVGPRPLQAALLAVGQLTGDAPDADAYFRWVAQAPMGDSIRSLIHQHLTRWDYEPKAAWAGGTPSNSRERRTRIYEELELSDDARAVADEFIPAFTAAEPIVVISSISEGFEPWYTTARRDSSAFYWSGYLKYLREVRGWREESLASLERSTNEILARVSDPTRAANYQTKGLVVGHVQSGKTANFTGVIARAGDAGYRLIIVLAGTLDILRGQTQRRLDKELVGKELISGRRDGTSSGQPHDYEQDSDWDQFISHGGFPSEIGAFDWQRLTGARDDYKALQRGIDALEFERFDPSKPLNDPQNLQRSKARLVVIKKNKTRIKNLAGDLRRIRASLDQIPALVIDDESDQASLNTSPPRSEIKARTAVNGAIVELLAVLPKAQYVGYTATPFANVFVDPDDAADLFPKDFIVSLDRPADYMGIRDFHDLEGPREGYSSNERAFIRDIRGDDRGAGNLPAALDSFVLAGALKLYRSELGMDINIKHHTMLIHTSHRQVDHDAMRRRVLQVLGEADYEAGSGLDRLRRLYEADFLPVTTARLPGFTSPQFQELKRYIGQCLQRLHDDAPVLVVNQANEADTPDFEGRRVWKVLVGGAKLSRGYTVEGLTVSYYRRTSSAADTLMQMGRWFGFRPGYKDLVRVFIGRDEPNGRRGSIDLYRAFEAVCRDEEEFRDRLKLYALPSEGGAPIKPSEVPPLVPSHISLLSPTSKNKMYNAVIKWENLSGDFVERALAPTAIDDLRHNERLFRSILSAEGLSRVELSLRDTGVGADVQVSALVSELDAKSVEQLVKDYRWEKPNVMTRELEYLKAKHVDPEIDRWILLAPQLQKPVNGTWNAHGHKLTVVERSLAGAKRHGRYSDPGHVRIAGMLAGALPAQPLNKATGELVRARQGVVLFYAVRLKGEVTSPPITVFALQFPSNHSPKRIEFSVKDPGRPDDIVVARR